MAEIEFPESGVATKIFEGFGKVLFKEFIIGQEPVSTDNYTGFEPVSILPYPRPGSSIKRPNPN